MKDQNTVIITGNLTQPPDVRTTRSGKEVATLKVATTHRWKDKEHQAFHRITAWEPVTKDCEGLSRGSRVHVVGSLRYGSYERDGQKTYTTDIVAEEVFVRAGSAPAAPAASSPTHTTFSDQDADLPY